MRTKLYTLIYKASFVTIKNKHENELIKYTQFKGSSVASGGAEGGGGRPLPPPQRLDTEKFFNSRVFQEANNVNNFTGATRIKEKFI